MVEVLAVLVPQNGSAVAALVASRLLVPDGQGVSWVDLVVLGWATVPAPDSKKEVVG